LSHRISKVTFTDLAVLTRISWYKIGEDEGVVTWISIQVCVTFFTNVRVQYPYNKSRIHCVKHQDINTRDHEKVTSMSCLALGGGTASNQLSAEGAIGHAAPIGAGAEVADSASNVAAARTHCPKACMERLRALGTFKILLDKVIKSQGRGNMVLPRRTKFTPISRIKNVLSSASILTRKRFNGFLPKVKKIKKHCYTWPVKSILL
jgi:hypothetical protein